MERALNKLPAIQSGESYSAAQVGLACLVRNIPFRKESHSHNEVRCILDVVHAVETKLQLVETGRIVG